MNTLKTTLAAAAALIALGAASTSAHAVNTIAPLAKLTSMTDRATVATQARADNAARSQLFAQGEGMQAQTAGGASVSREVVLAQLRGNGTAWVWLEGEPAGWVAATVFTPRTAPQALAQAGAR